MFEPVIKADLGLSAEEIETALASNNRNLARIHVALLKVVYLTVPPVRVGSHMFASDSRVCIICYPPPVRVAVRVCIFAFKSGVCILLLNQLHFGIIIIWRDLGDLMIA